MKWFQPIECDKTVKKPLICDYSNFEEYSYDEDSFKLGERINHWNDKIFMKATKKKYDGNPDDALQNAFMIPVYSERLIRELKNASVEGVQYLPIKIYKYNDDCLNGFCIANFINFVEAFDEENSIYNRFSEDFPNPNVRGEIAGVTKFVLKRGVLNGFDVIRLKEYNLRFFVSEKFKSIFEKNNFTGYSFKEIELV